MIGIIFAKERSMAYMLYRLLSEHWAAAMLLPWNKFLELNDSVAEDSEAVDDVGLKEAIGKLNSSF